MSRFRVGDRVRLKDTGALATVVNHVDRHFVDIDYDEPQPSHFADGSPTTTRSSCCPIDLLSGVDELDWEES